VTSYPDLSAATDYRSSKPSGHFLSNSLQNKHSKQISIAVLQSETSDLAVRGMYYVSYKTILRKPNYFAQSTSLPQ
jgi:hypothetical protein